MNLKYPCDIARIHAYLNKDFVQLNEGDKLSGAAPSSTAEHEVRLLPHNAPSLLVGLDPALRPKDVGVGAEDGHLVRHGPGAVSDPCPWGNELAVECVTFRADLLHDEATKGRVDPKPLVDDGLQVWELCCLVVCGGLGDFAVGNCLVNLFLELVGNPWVGGNV